MLNFATMTLYNSLKVFHILCATLFLMGIIASMRVWLTESEPSLLKEKIQSKTFRFIIPFAFLQLLSGFTMISLEHYALSEEWIKMSLIGFIFLIMSWFGFLCSVKRKTQRFFLTVCFLSLSIMIFMMANKV